MITPSFGITATERVLPKLALDFTTGLLDPRVTFTRTGNTATVIGSNGLLQSVNADIPRFDYSATTLQCKGLLIEESSVNLLTYSQDFSNAAWNIATNITVATSATVDPAGGTGSYSITAGAASATFGRTIVGTAGLTYTYSFWIRRKTGVGGVTVAVGDGNFQSISAQVSSAWNRVSVTSLNTSTTTIRAYIALSVSGDAVEIYGAQLEQKAFGTSYIPNLATGTTTRNADVATMTGTNFSSWYNQPEGTFSAQAIVPQLGRAGRILGVDSGTTANLFVMGTAATNQVSSDSVVASAYSGGAYSVGTITANTQFKMCSSYSNTTSEGTALNGAAISAANFSVGVTMTEMYIGTQVGPSSFLNGAIAKISYWPQKLTNNEVQAFSK